MEQFLRELPRTEESLRLVSQWLEQSPTPDGMSLSQEGEHEGSTASHGGPSHSDGVSTVSQDGHTDVGSETKTRKDLPTFDPSALVASKEGTFQTPPVVTEYLEHHLRRSLTKEEREALFKQHNRPDLPCCVPPKIDKYMSEYLGKRLPKEQDATLSKLQAAVLAIVRPLTSAWMGLMEKDEGDAMEEDLVPVTEVLTLIQCTLCLVGNASEYISQTRREKILEAIDQSWSKYASEPVPGAQDSLFGEEFQTTLTKRVEKDTALSKAAFISRRGQKDSGSRKSSPRDRQFF